MPLVVVVGLVFGALSGGFGGTSGSSSSAGPAGAVNATAPPNAQAQTDNCTSVLEKLPVTLNKLAPRIVHTKPETPFVVAWGNPAIVLSCGVDKPAALHPGSGAQFQAGGELSGPYYDVTRHGDANVWTSVDRAAYIAVTIPSTYQGADYIPDVSRAIAAALPPVCSTDSATADVDKLCTRRTT